MLTKESVLKATRLYREALAGNPRAQFAVAESISQGDFPSQIAPLVRRQLVARYEEQPSVVDRWTTPELVDSIDVDEQYNVFGFNQDNIAAVNMGDTFIPGTLPSITNREKYPQLGLQASGKTLRASTIGEAFGVDWQAIVNLRGTNINLLDDAVSEFAKHARNSEDAIPVKNLVTATGINTAKLGTTGHVAVSGGVNNPSLDSIQVVIDAVRQAQQFRVDGVDVYYDKFALLVAPARVPAVKQILTARTVIRRPARTGAASTTVSNEFEEVLDLGATIDVVPQRWLTALNPNSGGYWFLIPVGQPRPVITLNRLRGYEQPGFWVKDSNAKNYNGGDVPFLDGDFDSDAIQTKVRHVVGSNVMWEQGIIYSTGANA